jgi:hypothetical protein
MQEPLEVLTNADFKTLSVRVGVRSSDAKYTCVVLKDGRRFIRVSWRPGKWIRCR